jgi:chromosome segregation ATPase
VIDDRSYILNQPLKLLGWESTMTERETKPKVITYDDVKAVVEELTSEGRQPSLRTVKEHLGRGSLSTIQPILKQVMESFHSIPAEIEEKIRPILLAISDLNKSSVNEATIRLKSEISLLQKDLDELAKELSFCESSKAESESEVKKLSSENAALSVKLETVEKSLEETKKELSESRKEAEAARQEQVKLKFRHEDWLEAKAELAEAKAKAAKLEGKLEAFENNSKKERQKAETTPKRTATKDKDTKQVGQE